jgi:uncharacterized protein (DUF1778 family)
MKTHKHGMTGKRNAAKPDGEKAQSHLIARVTRADKAAWVRAANVRNLTLSEWVIETLNKKSGPA